MIALALTTKWMLITGQRLHQHPLLHNLPAEQLIGFWADDQASEHQPPAPPPHPRNPAAAGQDATRPRAATVRVDGCSLLLGVITGHGAPLAALLVLAILVIGAALTIVLVVLAHRDDRVDAIHAAADLLAALLPWPRRPKTPHAARKQPRQPQRRELSHGHGHFPPLRPPR